MFALSKTDNELILIIQRLMKKLLSVLILLGAYLTVFSQNIQVTGTVIGGSDREPLPGVNVVVKDATANGTITDLDGKFILTVPSNSILSVSYIGYKSQDIPVKGNKILHVVLEEDAAALEEVVVVGYGVQKESQSDGCRYFYKER